MGIKKVLPINTIWQKVYDDIAERLRVNSNLQIGDVDVDSTNPVPVIAPAGGLGVVGEDSYSIDAFCRWRVSNPHTLFDSKFIFDRGYLFWNEVQDYGTTTSTYNIDEAAVVIGVAMSSNSKRTRQTYQRFNYQPGKSQLIMMTAVLQNSGGGAKLPPGSGSIRRLGYFDDSNGLFFEDVENVVRVVQRSYVSGGVVDTEFEQSGWNLDTMDGTGASGITLDFARTQIFLIDFEWLGTGRVRFGFIVDGIIVYVHEINNANTINEVYMSTPNLPLRVQVENGGIGSAVTIKHISSTVISEGGEELGHLHTAEGSSGDALPVGATYAILGIRLRAADQIGASVALKALSVLVTDVDKVSKDYSIVNAIDTTTYDLNAGAFSESSDIDFDYTLNSIELNFSTEEEKTILITTSDGTTIYSGTNENKSVSITKINRDFNASENFTVAVTQFGEAGTMDCIAVVREYPVSKEHKARWILKYIPTVAGVFTYNDPAQFSSVDIATGVAANEVTFGIDIASGYVDNNAVEITELDNALKLGSFILGDLTTFVLCVEPISGTLSAHATMTWKEMC